VDFTSEDLLCVGCEAGTYKPERGAGSCTLCDEGKYSESIGASDEATCLSCPGNSTSDAGSGSMAGCECVLGYFGPSNTECGACEAGTYQDERGHASCNKCDAGTYSDAIAATSSGQCMACPADSDSPSGSVVKEACVCNAGFPGQNGGPCTACVAGTYTAARGPGVCTKCEAGKYSSRVGSPGEHFCLSCPSNSQSLPGSSDIDQCACLSG